MKIKCSRCGSDIGIRGARNDRGTLNLMCGKCFDKTCDELAMKMDTINDWYYDPKKKCWYHQHKIGIWPLKIKRFVPINHDGYCEKCHEKIPDGLRVQDW